MAESNNLKHVYNNKISQISVGLQ